MHTLRIEIKDKMLRAVIALVLIFITRKTICKVRCIDVTWPTK